MSNFNVSIFKFEAPKSSDASASKFDAIIRIPNANSSIGYITPVIRDTNQKLVDYQKVRAVKFFETITKVQVLLYATQHKNIIIEYGTMIGTYMLMRLVDATPTANIIFEGFDQNEWQHLKNFYDERNEVTITVFADKADNSMVDVMEDFCFVESFIPNTMLQLGWESESLFNKAMPLEYKENLITAFRFKTVVITLAKLGATKIALVNAQGLSDYSMECMVGSFEQVEVIGYDHPEVEETKLKELKEKFS